MHESLRIFYLSLNQMMKKEKKEKEKSFLTLLEQNGFVNSQSSSKQKKMERLSASSTNCHSN